MSARRRREILSAVALALLIVIRTDQTAGAQTSQYPALLVAEAQSGPCGAIVSTGMGFAPVTKVVMVVNGKTLAEQPVTDPTGTFSFTTNVNCDQISGTVRIQASDGSASVAATVAVGDAGARSAPSTTAKPQAPTSTDQATSRIELELARGLVLVVAGTELIVLVLRRRRRAQRRIAAP